MRFNIRTLYEYVKNTPMCVEKHPEEDLYIFGYYNNGTNLKTIWDDINIHCRGLILDGKGNVIEKAFSKFWTFKQYLSKDTVLLSEGKILKIPNKTYRITEKVDGTLTILYWIKDNPYLATQRSFTNPRALKATELLYKKYSHLFNKFNKNYTYLFEAIYPETNILIDYGDKEELILIGIIDKNTGKSLPIENYGFNTYRDFTNEYGHLDFNELVNLNLKNQEGFVLKFEDDTLIKLKFPWYSEAHGELDAYLYHRRRISEKSLRIRKSINKNNLSISKKHIWEYLRNNKSDNEIFSQVPDFYFLYGFEYWYETAKNQLLNNYNRLKEAHNNHKKDDEIWDLVKPKKDDPFDITNRLKTPHVYDTCTWNWKERLL